MRLYYELVGSAAAGEMGYWRWTIRLKDSNKIVQVGSVYGPLPDARKQVEAAVARLKSRIGASVPINTRNIKNYAATEIERPQL